VTLFDRPNGLWDFDEGNGPVDDRLELASFDEARQVLQVLLTALRIQRDERLADER
jgi:hypothetical protein